MASIDRFDTHSVSQESNSDHHNQGLEDLTDEQIQSQMEEILRINQMLTIENDILEKYHKKIEPFYLATIAGTSSSSLTTTPSGSMYDLSGGQQPQQQQTGGRYRKRSKSRSTQGDFRMRLTADQKCEIASKEIEELREESRKANEESEKNLDSYKAILEEADLRINEIKIEIHEFERNVLKAGYNPMNKKIAAEKLIKYFEDRMKERDTLVDKLKLKNESMRKRKQKLKAELKEKEEMGEVLHEVDFRQLKIENKQYMAKIDEKNTEMIKLKKMVGVVTQALNFKKKQLSLCLKEYDSLLNDIKSREKLLKNIETETKTVHKEHFKEESKNKKLRGQLENYKVPEVSDYVNAEDYLYNLQKELKVWERKVEIAEMALKINKQSWQQIRANADEGAPFGRKQYNNTLSGSAY
ncbi:coiled-coil domain-containing protein [Brachionus plicatilis]|uniref:Cilia- and flagella-associated protein 263 n=1 Tax=Brachionus plicatilis TaxID=10195 RepID=A0A3M7QTW3_BRAPC|nr:coiled-coil domain-containing protein [Brachionus plicatilis]